MKKTVKIMTAVVLVTLTVMAVFMLLDGTLMKKEYLSVWSEKYMDSLSNDFEKITAGAIKASSSHNMQPWLVEIDSKGQVLLYADKTKALPVIDKDNHQMLIGQGTFIKSFISSASMHGYLADVIYEEINFDEEFPLVATLTLSKSALLTAVDGISSSSLNFGDKKSDENDIKELMEKLSELHDNLHIEYVSDSTSLSELKAYLLQGTIIESKNKEAVSELLSVFRFTEYEKNEFRYGLSLASLPSLIKPFIQPIMNATASDWEAFGKSSITQFENRIENETGYFIITCREPEDMDYIQTGVLYQELLEGIDGYLLKPAVQLIEDFSDMNNLSQEFTAEYGNGKQVMIIIGLQPDEGMKGATNPRHLLEDILLYR